MDKIGFKFEIFSNNDTIEEKLILYNKRQQNVNIAVILTLHWKYWKEIRSVVWRYSQSISASMLVRYFMQILTKYKRCSPNHIFDSSFIYNFFIHCIIVFRIHCIVVRSTETSLKFFFKSSLNT